MVCEIIVHLLVIVQNNTRSTVQVLNYKKVNKISSYHQLLHLSSVILFSFEEIARIGMET